MSPDDILRKTDALESAGEEFAFLAGFPDETRCDRLLLASSPGEQLSVSLSPEVSPSIAGTPEDPFLRLQQLAACTDDHPESITVTCLGYDLKNCIERLPATRVSPLPIPDLYAVRFNKMTQSVLEKPGSTHSRPGTFAQSGKSFHAGEIRPHSSREEYVDAVKHALEYIYAGDIYQVNIAQRFYFDFSGSTWEFFKKVYALNPARFSFYLKSREFDIVVLSPERLLKTSGNVLESRPIKGTRPRGATPEEDRKQLRDLLSSEKEKAELIMITDLHRNDLGRVSEYGSVAVSSKRHVHRMANVFHTESIIRSTKRDDVSLADLLRAMMPGGSITGCPKVHAMEIIDELEPLPRQLYTGAVGYIGGVDDMDLAMTIRCVTFHHESGQGWFDVGSGIVADSNPEGEYEETLHKASSTIKALKG